MEARLYDVNFFGNELLKNLRPSSVRSLVKLYLREGAHPFFLRQAVRLVASKRRDEYKRITGAAEEVLLDYQRPKALVPDRTGKDFLSPISRLFDEIGAPRDIKDMGVVHGVILELLANVVDDDDQDLTVISDLLTGWDRSAQLVIDKVLSLPYADFAIYETVHYVLFTIEELLKGRRPASTDKVDYLRTVVKAEQPKFAKLLDAFFLKRVGQLGIPTAVGEMVTTMWSTIAPNIFWGAISLLVKFCFEQDPSEFPFTQAIETLLNFRQPLHAGRHILNGYPSNETTLDRSGLWNRFIANANFTLLAYGVQSEMPDLRVRHAIIRWLKIASHEARLNLLQRFVFGKHQEERWTINEKTETLVEDVFGVSAWKSICDFQDPSLWATNFEVVPGVPYREGINKSSPQYVALEKAVRQSPLAQHDPDIGEAFERVVDESSLTQEVAYQVLEENLDLVAGDTILVVSHLRDEWMPLRRKPKELLGTELPKVEICRHKTQGEQGAACRFQIPLSKLEGRLIRGTLDPDGEILIDNAPILSEKSKVVLRAVVAQSIRALLIPIFVETLPPTGQNGSLIVTGEPVARRPIIHTLGELGNERDQDDVAAFGSRINPVMAMLVFRWLLGHLSDEEYTFRLFVSARDITNQENYFRVIRTAKKDLMSGQRALSEIFMRVVRAHTRPLPAYLDASNTVRTREMSERARRHYDRYRGEGGRELNFTPVRKTYLLPNGFRVPIDVPRTFNQGCFASLEEAAQFIFDPDLKPEIRRQFRMRPSSR
jgi:hypothetical protein